MADGKGAEPSKPPSAKIVERRRHIHDEQTNIRARLFNTIAAGFLVAGIITPFANAANVGAPVAATTFLLMAIWFVGASSYMMALNSFWSRCDDRRRHAHGRGRVDRLHTAAAVRRDPGAAERSIHRSPSPLILAWVPTSFGTSFRLGVLASDRVSGDPRRA